jgi:4-hydroxythreonine-4-phosphate dehydrogenase
MGRNIKVGITHGDFNGVGYEVILKSLADERMNELCTPVIFGSGKAAAYYLKKLGLGDVRFTQIESAADAADGEISIVNVCEECKVDPGTDSPEAGHAAFVALEAACNALKDGSIDVLVTAPINKKNIQCSDFSFSGHTEYLQDRLGKEDSKSLMILFDEHLRVAMVTTHLPVSEIASHITKEIVADTINRFSDALKSDFRCERPKIAVLSLNPHCGDNGLLGKEETEIIEPAIKECNDAGIMVFGPYASDGFFGSGAYRKFDGVVAMYHDQGLAPFKTIAGAYGVNLTAGLPYVRTSPDHGTAYDIAGKNEADESSMRHAIYSAIDVYRAREAYEIARRNPLKKQYVERGADKTVDLTKDTDEE